MPRPATTRTRAYSPYLFVVVALSNIAWTWMGWMQHDRWVVLGSELAAITVIYLLTLWEYRWLLKRAERQILQKYRESASRRPPH
jgi:hypothetical protein